MIDDELRKLFVGEATRLEHEAIAECLSISVLAMMVARYGKNDLGEFCRWMIAYTEALQKVRNIQMFRFSLTLKPRTD